VTNLYWVRPPRDEHCLSWVPISDSQAGPSFSLERLPWIGQLVVVRMGDGGVSLPTDTLVGAAVMTVGHLALAMLCVLSSVEITHVTLAVPCGISERWSMLWEV
jgi:hypothetical protein